MLKAQDLSFSYDGLNPVLDSLEFILNPGEIVGVLGPTGSGKSTLAKILSGFIPRIIPGEISGQILFEGITTSSVPVAEMAKHIALVQQDPEGQICTLQVSDEVAFGPENYLIEPSLIQETVTDSLHSVGATHLHERPTYALSGGEKQRVVIAAMLACQPKYLILDEPSSSLDPNGIVQLRKVLIALKQNNVGILCIEHRLPTVLPVADRILELKDGKLSEWQSEQIIQSEPPLSVPFETRDKKPLLSAKDLCYSFGEQIAVNHASFVAYPSEKIALMGNNGSGKTTLLSMLGGLRKPDSGLIHIETDSIRNLSSRDIAKNIAMIFQNPNHQIFEKTVWKEQTLNLEVLELVSDDSLEDAEQSLKLASLDGIRERNPFSLSHGQKRKLNVTSVVTHSPRIYLFDEPLIGQDLPGRQFVSEILRKHAETHGVSVVVTHDSDFAVRNCSRILFMDNGSIMLDGSPKLVMERLEKMGRSEYAEMEVGK
ncbi:MAG: ATP-binding cassette domain-containing protein [Candidatus Thorarchaeota archaeon]|jgi:energy-coupling factor transport system ATP-binding protein